jgi:hypothetical protein
VTDVSRAPGVLWRVSSGRVVVLPPAGSEPLLLEGAAALLWLALGGSTNVAAIVDDLDGAIDAPRVELEEGIAQAVTDLVARGVVLTEFA